MVDFDAWDERLRRQGFWGRAAVLRAIQDTPGASLREKLSYWEKDLGEPNATSWSLTTHFSRVRYHAKRGSVIDILKEMIREDEAEQPPVETEDQARSDQRRRIQGDLAKAARLEEIDQAEREALQGKDPNSEAAKRLRTLFGRRRAELMRQ